MKRILIAFHGYLVVVSLVANGIRRTSVDYTTSLLYANYCTMREINLIMASLEITDALKPTANPPLNASAI